MFNEKLDKLIEMALMDGALTEKEKQVLFKNAETMGVDLDEFEMVLDARLFEKQKSMEEESSKTKESATKSDKFGDVKKCPACGSMVQSFQTKCSDCGHEHRGIEASNSIRAISEKLDKIDNERDSIKIPGLIGFFTGMTGGEPLEQQKDEIIGRKKGEAIKNFPIPNTREELLELIHFIHPKIDKTAKGDLNIKDWRLKFKEIIGRAKFAYKNDNKMLAELEFYENSAKGTFLTYFTQMDSKKKVGIGAIAFAILFFGLMIPFLIGMSSDHDKGVEKEKARLEVIIEKVNVAISKKDYNTALILSAQLKWEYSDSYSSSDTDLLIKAWDEKRETIIKTINDADISQKSWW